MGPGGDDERLGQGPARVEAVNRPQIGLAVPAGHRLPPWVPPLIAAAVVMLFAGLWEGLFYLGLPVPAGGASLEPGPRRAHGSRVSRDADRLGARGGARRNLGIPGTGRRLHRRARDRHRSAWKGRRGAHRLRRGNARRDIRCSPPDPALAAQRRAGIRRRLLGRGGRAVAGGLDISRFVPWLAGFLVLTITGERLELSG